MDTRTKIIGCTGSRLCQKNVRFVSGAFDPLLAEHAARLKTLAGPDHLLVVIVTNPANPLLAQRARAELVAALAVVDYVVMSTDIEDAPVTRQFMEQVVCKSRAS